MELTNLKVINEVLSKNGFSFKKSLGQNFLINPSVCPKMAENALEDADYALEIGPGIGVLTAELAKRSKKTLAIELDERLKPVLSETLAEYDNVEVVFGDAMELDLNKIINEHFPKDAKIAVCANLPYYITSPLIMRILESRLPITSLTVMVQKEVAQRMCAGVGNRQAGAVTVSVNYYCEPKYLFSVSKGSFTPAPNVDSAVMSLKIRKEPPVKVLDEKFFFKVIKAAFAQRRKTLLNSVSSGLSISKERVKAAISACALKEDARAEMLSIEQVAELSNCLLEHNI